MKNNMTSGVLLKGNKNLILLAITIILVVAVFVIAQTQQDLEAELAQLEGELVDEILEVKNGRY